MLRHQNWIVFVMAFTLVGAACSTSPQNNKPDAATDTSADVATDSASDTPTADMNGKTVVRFATFNASLFGDSKGDLEVELGDSNSQRARAIAEILQRVRPDVVLLNEFDWDANGTSARLFSENYLEIGQGGADAIVYPHRYVPDTNTGIPSGIDLNNDGDSNGAENSQAYGDDALGFGRFRGQFGMVVYSKYPITNDAVRSFQNLLWKDMTDNLLPTDFYTPEAIELFRLSSKNHVDVPIDVDGNVVHFLISHPTPPSFDGPEDRNGKRNHDEIRFWRDYVSGENAGYIVDDNGQTGALGDASFVLAGDWNSDPVDADTIKTALQDLLALSQVNDTQPESLGGPEAASRDGRANDDHIGDPKFDTADFSDREVGNIRVDYALPSSDLNIVDSAVFWPASGDENATLVNASDHRVVYIDIEF